MKRHSHAGPATPLCWLVESLLGNQRPQRAAARQARRNRNGLRHFSANRKAVPLDQTAWMTDEILRREREIELELGIFPVPATTILPNFRR